MVYPQLFVALYIHSFAFKYDSWILVQLIKTSIKIWNFFNSSMIYFSSHVLIIFNINLLIMKYINKLFLFHPTIYSGRIFMHYVYKKHSRINAKRSEYIFIIYFLTDYFYWTILNLHCETKIFTLSGNANGWEKYVLMTTTHGYWQFPIMY